MMLASLLTPEQEEQTSSDEATRQRRTENPFSNRGNQCDRISLRNCEDLDEKSSFVFRDRSYEIKFARLVDHRDPNLFEVLQVQCTASYQYLPVTVSLAGAGLSKSPLPTYTPPPVHQF
jgi:hypothetical protein